ncbi:MAG: hypothetical protein LBS79_07170, partial [Tannerella sp.]|nr:hypothetical protein [Tannerella sp.]
MEKKNLHLTAVYTYVMMIMTLCCGTVWGQQGVLLPQSKDAPPLTPRRVDSPLSRDTIKGAADVGYVFGAGESSAVNEKVVWPASGNTLAQNSILIGSDYSENAVIGIYDNDGEVSEFLLDVRFYKLGQGTLTEEPDPIDQRSIPPDVGMYLDTIRYDIAADPLNRGQTWSNIEGHYSNFNSTNSEIVATVIYKEDSVQKYTLQGAIFWPYKHPDSLKYYVPIHLYLNGWFLKTIVFYGVAADTLYTSTRDKNNKYDDGKPLLHTIGGKYNENGVTLDTYKSALNDINYLRPTTVLLLGENRLDSITARDIEWYAACMRGVPVATEELALTLNYMLPNFEYSGWVSYKKQNVKFDLVPDGIVPSGRYVDAAVRLLDGADVSVKGSAKDATNTPYSLHDPSDITDTLRTDALLVLPGKANSAGERSNFRLKIGGDASLLHTQDSGAYNPDASGANPLEDGYLYSYSGAPGGPGAPFPISQTQIYLSGGTNQYKEVSGLRNYDHPREPRTLTDFTTGDSTTYMPYFKTSASVYGVRGNYYGNT